MYRVSVKGKFYSAHLLTGYKGDCKNIHGHNYYVEVIITGEKLNELGILMDFKEVKENLDTVLNRLDHALIINDCPENREIIQLLNGQMKLHLMHENPTAENLSKFIYDKLTDGIFRPEKLKTMVESIKVWETENSYAEYIPEVKKGGKENG